MRHGIAEFQVTPETSVHDVLVRIDRNRLGFALVTSPDGRLLGAITDGDVRRALLAGDVLNRRAGDIMNSVPRSLPLGTSPEACHTFLQRNRITFVPLLDEDGRVADVFVASSLPGRSLDEVAVVVMAGGLGSRLGDLTRDVPKPLLQVDGEPILERIVKGFRAEGFRNFIFCVNYKADMIEAHFGDGSALDVSIDYTVEPKRLGTGGPLSLIDTKDYQRLMVTNADILCTTNYRDMIDFHIDQEAVATMAVREHAVEIPFGVVETDGFEIRSLREKPRYTYFINAGYYVLERAALEHVPKGEFFDMPSLFEVLHRHDERTRIYPTTGTWLDIGRVEDLERARDMARQDARDGA